VKTFTSGAQIETKQDISQPNLDLKSEAANTKKLNNELHEFYKIAEQIENNAKEIDTSFVELFLDVYERKILNYVELWRVETAILKSQSISNLSLDDIHTLLKPFVNHYYGSLEFYNKLGCQFCKFIEESGEINYRTFLRMLTQFSQANAITEELSSKVNQYIEKNLLQYEKVSDHYPAFVLSNLAFYFSLNYQNTRQYHEQFFEILRRTLKVNREIFYKTLEKMEYYRYIWNFLQTIKLNDKELFDNLTKEKIISKIPFKYTGFGSSVPQEQILEMVRKITQKEVHKEKMIGIYHIDMFISPKTAIEINGYHHYFDRGSRRSGLYQVKYNNLKKMGLDVREIPLTVWRNKNNSEQEAYLKDILREI